MKLNKRHFFQSAQKQKANLSLATVYPKETQSSKQTYNNIHSSISLVILQKIPKHTTIKSDDGLILIDLAKSDNDYHKRTINLKNTTQNIQPISTQSKSSLKMAHGMDYQERQRYLSSQKTINCYQNNNGFCGQANFVKIGQDYEAITNEYSQSQVSKQKDVKQLFNIVGSDHPSILRIKPLQQSLWIYQRDHDGQSFQRGDIFRMGSQCFKIKMIKTSIIQDTIEETIIKDQTSTITDFVDQRLGHHELLNKFLRNRLKTCDNSSKSYKHKSLLLKQNISTAQQTSTLQLIMQQTQNQCRICFNNNSQLNQLMHGFSDQTIDSDDGNENMMMISPCKCKGTISNVHFKCLKRWIDTKLKDLASKSQIIDMNLLRCDICKSKLINKHEDFINETSHKLIDLESINEFKDKCIVQIQQVSIKSPQSILNEYIIIFKDEIKIGRENFNDIYLDKDNTIISYKDDRVFIIDNNSKFGTPKLYQKMFQFRLNGIILIQPIDENVIFEIFGRPQVKINAFLDGNRSSSKQKIYKNQTVCNTNHISNPLQSFIKTSYSNNLFKQASDNYQRTMKLKILLNHQSCAEADFDQQHQVTITNQKSTLYMQTIQRTLDRSNVRTSQKRRKTSRFELNQQNESPYSILRNMSEYQPKYNIANANNNYSQILGRHTPNIQIRRDIQSRHKQIIDQTRKLSDEKFSNLQFNMKGFDQ